MSIRSAFFKGIIYAVSMLTPLSYSGHDSLFRFTGLNLTKGGYDNILPLVVQLPVIITLVYFLKKDLGLLLSSSGSLLKDIKEKNFNINTDKKDKKLVLMVLFGGFTLILTLLFELIFKGLTSNLIITTLGFLISALFVIGANLVKERTLKESNETILNSMYVALFQAFSVIPGISGFGGMYFAGVKCGFKREFSMKFAYILTLVWTFSSFIRNIILLIINGINIHFGVFYYIFAFLGALGISLISIYGFEKAFKHKKTIYFAIYNIAVAVIVFTIWLRG